MAIPRRQYKSFVITPPTVTVNGSPDINSIRPIHGLCVNVTLNPFLVIVESDGKPEHPLGDNKAIYGAPSLAVATITGCLLDVHITVVEVSSRYPL